MNQKLDTKLIAGCKLKKIIKKPGYIKESTIDLSNLRPIVNPDLKKRNDKLFKTLVDNLNRNVINKKRNIKLVSKCKKFSI